MFRPGGFPEYSPAEQLVFDQLKEIIEKSYGQYGFAHIHTPAIESNQVLLSKNWEDAVKQIFWLFWLSQWITDKKEYSLHFDLTVPFARYVLDWENELIFPFKRYQIQPVRRGERSQRWRFREFRQSDIDVIWSDENQEKKIWKNLFYDAEMLFVIAKTLWQIIDKFLEWKEFTLHLNNRYLLSGFFSQFDQNIVAKLYSLLDRYYKISLEEFKKELETLVSKKEAEKIINFTQTKFENLNPNLVDNEDYIRWYLELQEVLKYVNDLNVDWKFKIVWDPCIIRGLDYYTWTVYETFFDDDMALGSISSGWRYENLTWYINPKKKNFSWVGWSIGLSRMVFLILEKTKPELKTKVEYLFINFPETSKETLKLLQEYVKNWKTVEYYPSPEKLWKQFGYADKKWIENVVILGEGEKNEGVYKVKNMKDWTELPLPITCLSNR